MALWCLVVGILPVMAVVPAGTPVAVAQQASGPDVTAAGAVLYDPLDQRVLWGRESDVPRPMASTTKIMTTLLAVEAGAVDDVVTVSADAAAVGRIPGGASLGLEEGEQVPMATLLEGLMLRSGNDAAVAVAEHVAGTEQDFVTLMNARAAELGLDATRFLNASGLTDDPTHQASPLDLARLAVVALQEPLIARWASSEVAASREFGTITNRNELLGSYRGADGVKTGFTTLAGLCLVASAERRGRPLVAVVLDSEDHFADARALLDHGYGSFRRVSAAAGEPVVQWRTSAGATAAVPTRPVGRTVPVDADARLVVVPAATTAAGVASGARLGSLRLRVDGTEVAATTLAADEEVRAGPRTVGAAAEDGLRALARLERRTLAPGRSPGPDTDDGR